MEFPDGDRNLFFSKLPDDGTVAYPMLDFMQEDWKHVSRPAVVCWIVFYMLFMGYAASNTSGFLFIDNANLVVHEGGHMLFSWFGETLCLWGGTLLQLLVPSLLAAYFFHERQATGFAFCLFMLFENLLYVSTYMADARAQVLPLVSIGNTDEAGHDWFNIFSSVGVLQYDIVIARVTRAIGWIGMCGSVVWLAMRLRGQGIVTES